MKICSLDLIEWLVSKETSDIKKRRRNLIFYLLNNRMHFSPYLLACTLLAFAFRYDLNAHVFSLPLRVHLNIELRVSMNARTMMKQPCAMNMPNSIYRCSATDDQRSALFFISNRMYMFVLFVSPVSICRPMRQANGFHCVDVSPVFVCICL